MDCLHKQASTGAWTESSRGAEIPNHTKERGSLSLRRKVEGRLSRVPSEHSSYPLPSVPPGVTSSSTSNQISLLPVRIHTHYPEDETPHHLWSSASAHTSNSRESILFLIPLHYPKKKCNENGRSYSHTACAHLHMYMNTQAHTRWLKPECHTIYTFKHSPQFIELYSYSCKKWKKTKICKYSTHSGRSSKIKHMILAIIYEV